MKTKILVRRSLLVLLFVCHHEVQAQLVAPVTNTTDGTDAPAVVGDTCPCAEGSDNQADESNN
eukprot:CAMPEP_0194060026 /NCGR_PEP_ID=MMETSP0009_2-20130614/70644_1 /TAXON_ID=210454 /ORGANISM="Grammatophora oceanica, Strain CCMP 410" /LENGTH=62 /DNA_ID=CAMNT_0038710807 /DNA_START=551 /DNA_END=736 /DNA_ORIENTATION=+